MTKDSLIRIFIGQFKVPHIRERMKMRILEDPSLLRKFQLERLALAKPRLQIMPPDMPDVKMPPSYIGSTLKGLA